MYIIDERASIQTYLALLKRRWFSLLSFTVMFMIISLIVLFKQTPIYEAKSKIRIEYKSPKVVATQEAFSGTPEDRGAYENYFKTQINLLKSPTFLLRVVDSIELQFPGFFESALQSKSSFINKYIISFVKKNILKGFLANEDNKNIKMDLNQQRLNKSAILAKNIKINPIYRTELVEILYYDKNPSFAKIAANVLALDYIKYNLDNNLSKIDFAVESLAKKMNDQKEKVLQAERVLHEYIRDNNIIALPQVYDQQALESIKTEYANLQGQLDNFKARYTDKHPKVIEMQAQVNSLRNKISGLGDNDTNEKLMKYRVLERVVETNNKLYQMLLTRLKEVDLTSSLSFSNIYIVDQASLPKSPFSPNIKKSLIISIIMALFVGVFLLLCWDYFDKTIKSPSDVVNTLKLNLLGFVPRINLKNEISKSRLVDLEPFSPVSESIRQTRTEIEFLLSKNDNKSQVVLVTSAEKGEGKTFITSNLAISFAKIGRKVVLVDCDLRKPKLSLLYENKKSKGISDYIIDDAKIDSIINKTEINNLSIIGSGRNVGHPDEMLCSTKIKVLISALKEKFDYILLDSPPITNMADGLIIAKLTDGFIKVVKSETSSTAMINYSLEKLKRVNANILGVILNDVKLRNLDYYYKYYNRYYYQERKGLLNKIKNRFIKKNDLSKTCKK